MYKKYFKTISLAIIIPIVFLYAFQQGASLAYHYWLSVWADDPIVNGTQMDTDLKLTVFGTLGFAQGPSERFRNRHSKSSRHRCVEVGLKSLLPLSLFRRGHLRYDRRHLPLRHHRLPPPAHGAAEQRAALPDVLLRAHAQRQPPQPLRQGYRRHRLHGARRLEDDAELRLQTHGGLHHRDDGDALRGRGHPAARFPLRLCPGTFFFFMFATCYFGSIAAYYWKAPKTNPSM